MPSSNSYSIATAGCVLACLNCQNWEISQTSPKKTRNYDLPPVRVVDECIKNDVNPLLILTPTLWHSTNIPLYCSNSKGKGY